MNEKTKPFFYGWVVVAACAAIYAVMTAGTFCFGLFIKPMSEALGWTRANVVLGVTYLFIVSSALFVVTGKICDWLGPKPLTFTGGMFLAIGFFICSQVTELWQFYLGYGVCGGIGIACIFVPLAATISKWFIKHRGIALGILYAGGGVGGMVLSPILQSVINASGWRSAWLVLAVVSAAVAIPVTFLVKKEPSDMGLKPLGEGEPAKEEGKGTADMYAASRNYTLKEALKSSQLWIYNVGIFLAMAAVIGIQHNMVPYATDKGISAGVAAMALGIASGFNAFGRIAMGFMSDRFGTRRCLLVTMLGMAVLLFYLITVASAWMIIVFAILFGFTFGSIPPLNARAVADLFGTENLGAIMGVSGMFAAIGPAFGPIVIAAIRDRTGSYSLALAVAGMLVIVSIFLFAVLKLPGKGGKQQVSY